MCKHGAVCQNTHHIFSIIRRCVRSCVENVLCCSEVSKELINAVFFKIYLTKRLRPIILYSLQFDIFTLLKVCISCLKWTKATFSHLTSSLRLISQKWASQLWDLSEQGGMLMRSDFMMLSLFMFATVSQDNFRLNPTGNHFASHPD